MKIYGIKWTDSKGISWQGPWAFKYVQTAKKHIEHIKEEFNEKGLEGELIEMELDELPF